MPSTSRTPKSNSSICLQEDEQDELIYNLKRTSAVGWLQTCEAIISKFGLTNEFRSLFFEFREKDRMSNQLAAKTALRILQLEYDLDLVEVLNTPTKKESLV